VSLYGRIFAALYDRTIEGTERAGLARRRHDLLKHAAGSVVEIGAGTGLNLDHYPPAAQRLDLTEPEPPMADRLRRRAALLGKKAEVTLAPAEFLPFADDSFDTAVSTLALCTVDSPERALAELRRVLRPGGTFLFLEHVRSEEPRLARWQDRLAPLWRRVGAGCNCNRPTEELIRRAGFNIEQVEQDRLPKAPPLVRPLIVGRALAP
jgi:ubiquinone/menaquinone biosynthesis C-methylase UbiE